MSAFLPIAKYKTSDIYIRLVEINSIKCFQNDNIFSLLSVTQQIHKWTIVIGNNGTGKSTLLQCITISSPQLTHENKYIRARGTKNIEANFLKPELLHPSESSVKLHLFKNDIFYKTDLSVEHYPIDDEHENI